MFFLAHTASMSLIEELQKTNQLQEEEIRILRLSSQLPPGGTSLASVIEAQDRKIKALEIAQKVNQYFSSNTCAQERS